jgi:hypothetical protein
VSCKVGVKSRVDRASLSAMGRCVWWKIVLLLLLFELQARRACIPAIGAIRRMCDDFGNERMTREAR